LGVSSAHGEVVFVAGKRATIPIFVREQPRPVLIIRIDSIFKDYQRKGFFRIGLLPQWVAEGVTLEFRECASQFLAGLKEV
jgi:hypothetical protein